MKHRHRGGGGRYTNHQSHEFHHPGFYGRSPHGHGHHGHRGRGGGRGGRLFDYGELRLLTLALIAERPRHGYELIKDIGERLGGAYNPSPGVIYPTLSWLDDMGYAAVEVEEGGRKRYRATAEGETFLAANAANVEALVARVTASSEGGRGHIPAPVVRAMENLKVALRLRMREGPIDQAAAEAMAAAIDAAAQTVERG